MRADHALVVASPQRPDRQEARHLALIEHRLHERARTVRRKDRVERTRRAERIPAGERRIERLRARVGDVARLEVEVIERGVPGRALGIRSLDRRPRQNLVPRRAHRGLHAVEIPCGDLRREIRLRTRREIEPPGIFSAPGRQTDLDHERFAPRHLEVEDVARRLLAIPARQLRHAFARTVEEKRETVRAFDPVLRVDPPRKARQPLDLHGA